MSTRESILYDEATDTHLYADAFEKYEEAGIHLDLHPVASLPADKAGQYGDFWLEMRGDGRINVGVRIPRIVCEAIADYVAKRREWRAVSP